MQECTYAVVVVQEVVLGALHAFERATDASQVLSIIDGLDGLVSEQRVRLLANALDQVMTDDRLDRWVVSRAWPSGALLMSCIR